MILKNNLNLNDLENECLKMEKSNFNYTPIFYFKYVDDSLLCAYKKHIDIAVDTFNFFNDNF